MADKKGNASRQSENQRQSEDEDRNSEENAGQLRETSEQVVQSQDGASRSLNTQVATSTASKYDLKNKGPAQVGSVNTIHYIYKGPIHIHHHHQHPPPPNITNVEQYYRRVEQQVALGHSPVHPGLPPCPVSQGLPDHQLQSQTQRKTVNDSGHHANSSLYHVPSQCKFCQEYHTKNHPPITELPSTETDTTRRKTGKSTPRAKNNQPRPEQGNEGQQSLLSSRPSQSDVTCTVPSADQAGKGAESSEAKPCERLPQTTSEARSQSSPVYSVGIPDSVCIIDRKGRSLEPGDVVWFKRDGGSYVGIYVGDQQVVYPDYRRGRMVVKEELKLAEPFRKMTVSNRGPVPVFPPEDRVGRAVSRVGTRYTEGDWSDGKDFPYWIFTGMGVIQAMDRGFYL